MEYELQERRERGSWSTVYTGDVSEYQVVGNSPGGYDYRVRAIEGGYRSDWSEVVETVVVQIPPPSIRTISNPGNRRDFSVTAYSITGADEYQFRMRVDELTDWIRTDWQSDRTLEVEGMHRGTAYFQARCRSATSTSDWGPEQTTDIRVPPAPTLSDIDNPDRSGSFVVDWYEVSDAESSWFT